MEREGEGEQDIAKFSLKIRSSFPKLTKNILFSSLFDIIITYTFVHNVYIVIIKFSLLLSSCLTFHYDLVCSIFDTSPGPLTVWGPQRVSLGGSKALVKL